jgi:hypothetical protein
MNMPQENEKSKPLNMYIEMFHSLYDELIEETFQKSEKETKILFEIINNWIDAADLFKEYKLEEVIHSIPGIIFIYLWRAGNWISYEILTGHYFDAFKDVRFLFEGSLLAINYDYFIDKKIYEKWGSFAELSLKAEIVELAERLREKVKRSKEKENPESLKLLVRKDVLKLVNKSKLTDEKKKKYIDLYCEILAQPELYWSVGKIIKEYASDWKLGNHAKILESTWGKLSLYTHFSRAFFDLALERPEEVWIEHYNKELLEKCCEFYITTIDLFLSTLVISFPKISSSLSKITRWWDENLNIELGITKKVLSELNR